MEPQPAKAARAAQLSGLLARGRHPPTLHMVIEALRAQDEKKGVSVIAIKRFILAKYPTVDPVRLKYLLKQALTKGLSRGDLVRPGNSSATGATGRFKLAPKKQRRKQPPGQVDSDGELALKPGQKGTTKPPRAPVAGARQRGAAEEKPTAAKQKPRAKPTDVRPPAAAKPRSDGAKPPRAAGRPRAPGKGHLGPPVALAAEDEGRGDGDGPAGAGFKGPRKAPVGKGKGKAPKAAQQDAPKARGGEGKARGGEGKARGGEGKARGGEGKARKPRAAPAARQGEAGLRKAAAPAVDRKGP